MNIKGKITGIKYKIFLAEKLQVTDIDNFNEYRICYLIARMGLIFITAVERSVACGNKKERNFCLKGRTNKVLPILAKMRDGIAITASRCFSVMKIKPFQAIRQN